MKEERGIAVKNFLPKYLKKNKNKQTKAIKGLIKDAMPDNIISRTLFSGARQKNVFTPKLMVLHIAEQMSSQ